LTGNQDKRHASTSSELRVKSKKTKVKGTELRAQGAGQEKIKVKRYAT
jgi:hypothetical protein